MREVTLYFVFFLLILVILSGRFPDRRCLSFLLCGEASHGNGAASCVSFISKISGGSFFFSFFFFSKIMHLSYGGSFRGSLSARAVLVTLASVYWSFGASRTFCRGISYGMGGFKSCGISGILLVYSYFGLLPLWLGFCRVEIGFSSGLQ